MSIAVSSKAAEIVLQSSHRPSTAGRLALLQILWNERYLTGVQLMRRVGCTLGKNCFGIVAQEATFHRDIRVVRKAFEAAGYTLEHSRNKGQKGYYLQGQPALSPAFEQLIKASIAEVDQRQIDIYRQLSAAERFRQGSSISDISRNVVAYRIRQEQPELTPLEANRIALERAYTSSDTSSWILPLA